MSAALVAAALDEAERLWAEDCDFPPDRLARVFLVPDPHHFLKAVHWSRVDEGTAPPHAREYVLAEAAEAERKHLRAQRDRTVEALRERSMEAASLARQLAEVTAERDAAVARAKALRAGIDGVVYAIQENILRGEGESFKDVAGRVLAADDAAGGGK